MSDPVPAPFIAVEGIDGTGKSTQVALLADWLRQRGHDVVTCVDPGGTPLGATLRALLLDHRQTMSAHSEALLFMASRAELVSQTIRPALEAGKAVVSDRFLLSNVVYQGHAGTLDPPSLWQLGMFATGGLLPDQFVILDMPVERTAPRRKASEDRIEARGLEYQERVRRGFLLEAGRMPERCRVVSAEGTIDEVQAAIQTVVEAILASGGASQELQGL